MKILYFLFLFSVSFIFLSCGGISRVESMEGMMYLPPARSVQNRDTTLLVISAELLTPINSPRTGRIQRDSLEINNRFRWSVPKAAIACNIDLYLSKYPGSRSAISLGIGSTFTGNRFNRMLRFGFANEKNYRMIGVRFDIGITNTVVEIVRYPQPYDIPAGYYYNPYDPSNKLSSTGSRSGRYIPFTLGIRQPESHLRINLQYAFCWQSLSGNNGIITSSHSEPGAGLFYSSITPFISYNVSGKSQLVGGFRMIKESGVTETNGPFAVFPFIQYEFGL